MSFNTCTIRPNQHRQLPAIRGLSACLGSDSGKAAAIGAAPGAGRLGRGKDPLAIGAAERGAGCITAA